MIFWPVLRGFVLNGAKRKSFDHKLHVIPGMRYYCLDTVPQVFAAYKASHISPIPREVAFGYQHFKGKVAAVIVTTFAHQSTVHVEIAGNCNGCKRLSRLQLLYKSHRSLCIISRRKRQTTAHFLAQKNKEIRACHSAFQWTGLLRAKHMYSGEMQMVNRAGRSSSQSGGLVTEFMMIVFKVKYYDLGFPLAFVGLPLMDSLFTMSTKPRILKSCASCTTSQLILG